jgi:hypothetical protein
MTDIMELTQDRLRELLDYDPDTGIFTWMVNRRGGKAAVGVVAGSRNTDNYVSITVDGEEYLAHRLAFLYMTGAFPPKQVDHINTAKSDNRWCNLRACTSKEQMDNPITKAKHKAAMAKMNSSPEHKALLASITSSGGKTQGAANVASGHMSGMRASLNAPGGYWYFIKHRAPGVSYQEAIAMWHKQKVDHE